MPREVFVAGQVLTAAELNVVSDQSVMVFADSSARGTAIPSPSEGMVTYLEDTNGVEVYNGSAFTGVGQGSILQVVSTTKTDTYSESLATGVLSSNLVTGLTASITPSSTSSKILVTVSVPLANSSYFGYGSYVMRRDGTAIGVPDAAGSRTQLTAQGGSLSQNSVDIATLSQSFLDSPGTTSSITYGISLHNPSSGTATVYANRSFSDQNNSRFARPISTITLMEVAG